MFNIARWNQTRWIITLAMAALLGIAFLSASQQTASADGSGPIVFPHPAAVAADQSLPQTGAVIWPGPKKVLPKKSLEGLPLPQAQGGIIPGKGR